MHPKSAKFLEGPILPALIALSIPIVLANLLQTAYQLVDAFWVGRLGASAVAAVSVSFPVIFLSIALGAGFAVAGSTLIAQYVGAKNQGMVNRVAAQTLLMVIVSSLVIGVIGYVSAPWILTMMGVGPDVYHEALGFMRVAFMGTVFTFGFAMFQSVLRSVGEATLPLYIVFGTVVLNFFLDPLLIFGWGPLPPHGVMGAALATLVTQGLAMLIGLIILFEGKYGIQLRPSDFLPDFAFIRRAFFLGLPASIEQSARALGFTVLTFLVASFGTVAAAAYGIGTNVAMAAVIPAMGLSMAVATLVGQNIGAGNIARAAAIARLGATLSFFLLSTLGAVVFVFASHIAAFFVPGEPEVVAHAATFVRIMAFSFGFIGLQFALTGVFRAAGDMLAPMILALASQWVIQFPIAYLLSKHTDLGMNGLWWAFPSANVIIALITLAWYSRGSWKSRRLTKDEQFAEKVTEEILVEEGVRQ